MENKQVDTKDEELPKEYQKPLVPHEINKWNWGAFMFNWMWGVGNKTYLPLLSLIPVFGFFWNFVVGFKGNAWAWEEGNYELKDLDTFKKIQATWNLAGLVNFIVSLAIVLVYGLFVYSTFMNVFNK